MYFSPFIMNDIGLGLVFWHLDNDLRHVNLLLTLNVLFEPLLVCFLCLFELLPERTIERC